MGRHKSRRDSDRSSSKRKERYSRSPSSHEGKKRREERVERLERIVESLDRRSYTRSSCIHRGDEQMIPMFDTLKDDLVIEKWIEHVDDLAMQYDWDNRAIMRLIP